jgi:hypothetical protein
MGKSRSERRAIAGLVVDVFSTETVLGWNVIYRVPAAKALEMVALKQWREIWYENGELAGVQPLKPEERKTLHQVLVERLVAVTITLPELKRNAGVYGRSTTIGMPEWRRLQRAGKRVLVGEQLRPVILEPEDATERAIEKVRLWPYPASVMRDKRGDAVTDDKGVPIFGDRAVRVYPPAPRKRSKG